MAARTVGYIGSTPIQVEDPEMFTSETRPEINPVFALIYNAAITLRAGGMSDGASLKTARNIYESLCDIVAEESDNA